MSLELTPKDDRDHCEALTGRIGHVRKELGQARALVSAELRRAQAEEAIFKHALQSIAVRSLHTNISL